jgi:hypothetical protein
MTDRKPGTSDSSGQSTEPKPHEADVNFEDLDEGLQDEIKNVGA